MFVSREEYKKRLQACKGCEKFISVSQQCGVCKCVMPVKAFLKTTGAGKVECPHPDGSKWKNYETNTSAYSDSLRS